MDLQGLCRSPSWNPRYCSESFMTSSNGTLQDLLLLPVEGVLSPGAHPFCLPVDSVGHFSDDPMYVFSFLEATSASAICHP